MKLITPHNTGNFIVLKQWRTRLNLLVFVLSIFLLNQGVLQAQAKGKEENYIKGQLYFKVVDDYRLKEESKDGSVDLERNLPFLLPLLEEFKIKEIKNTFYFSKSEKLRRTFRLYFEQSEQTEILIRKLSSFREIEYAEKIAIHHTYITPNDLGGNNINGQWALHRIKAEHAWDISTGNSNIIVAVVDNAFQTDHPDLEGKFINGRDVADNDNNVNPPSANFDHGTHVAGIVGANTNNDLGIAAIGYDVSIMPIKATPNAIFSPTAITFGYEGISWSATNGADIINLSWGKCNEEALITEQNVINDASALGAIIIASAGNKISGCNFPFVGYPAAYDNVISVANTDINDKKSGNSNYGSWIDISAPGTKILSTIPFGNYDDFSGTSMAAPLVAGLCGLMLSVDPTLNANDILDCLSTSADNTDGVNPSFVGQLGAGRINACRAMLCVSGVPNIDFCAPQLVLNDYGHNNGGWRVNKHPRIMADVNGDGQDDIVGFGDAGVLVALSMGTGFTSQQLWLNNFGYNAGGWRTNKHVRLTGDVNGDGKEDIVGFGDAGVYLSLSTGSSFMPPALVINDFGYNAGGWRIDKHPRKLADVNGDGKADIVGFGYSGVYLALANSSGTGFNSQGLVYNDFGYGAGGWRVNKHPRTMADVNGDGKADIIGFGYSGVYLALANSSGTGFNPQGLVYNGFGYGAGGWRVDKHPRMMADINGDGQKDIVGFGTNGVWAALSTGTSFNSLGMELSDLGYAQNWRINKHQRMLGDINNDGMEDIVGFGDYNMFVAVANGNGFDCAATFPVFTHSTQGWRPDRHPIMLANIDKSDESKEVVGFGYAGVYTMNCSDGEFFLSNPSEEVLVQENTLELGVINNVNSENENIDLISTTNTGTEFKVFPNPNNGVFNVQLNEIPDVPTVLRIIDLNGREIFRKDKISNSTIPIDLSSYPKGIYNIQIQTNLNLVNRKIVIQ